MVAPGEFLAFIAVNFIVWPGFALLWYFLFQRSEEDEMDTMAASQSAGIGTE